MPKFLEDKLKAEANTQGMTGRAADRYAFGAMNNMGAMYGNKETAKGARMDAKHARDMKTPAAKPKGARHPHGNLGKYLHPKKSR